jgi:GTP:adenosylcobinamide-phosphate guanylyltransferase
MTQLHIIVQAGGRGSRLRHHTWNKPKCLVSVRGKPLLYHLFERFPQAYFHIIGDYAFEQLEKYLQTNNPGVEYTLNKSSEKGTCSGIANALNEVPPDSELIVTWSDLIIGKLPEWLDTELPVICTTKAFTCRWTYQNGTLIESPGPEGVSGIFYFKRAELFPEPPKEGEFVKWVSKNILQFEILECNDLEELGDFATIETQNDRAGFSRFFNEVVINEDSVSKRAIDLNYTHLIEKEQAWYKSVSDLGFRRIPKIYSTNPYTMERIQGKHAYQMLDLNDRERGAVLADYLDTLTNLHDLGTQKADLNEVKDTYITKTLNRVNSVSNIIPNFDQAALTVNGMKCRNVFHDKHKQIFNDIEKILEPKYFTPIHGDPTFSNSLIDKYLRVWFIDPRGYFSKPGIWGDSLYDFAKVYYSAVGGYDAFNRRKFKLVVDSETAEIIMEESSFSNAGKEIFNDFFGKDLPKIEILHGLIWLALSGYAKDDIDSVIGSFYLGLYYLEQGVNKL